jgi:L-fuculose-phosphate aldolase
MLELAEQMCAIGRRAYARQLVAGTEGNFSCRLGRETVLCTPTFTCKGLLRPVDLCVVDLRGNQVAGVRPRSSEILMHLGLYQADPEIHAVIHTHPPFATSFSVAGAADLGGVLPEGDVFLGEVPLVPYCTPGTPEMAVPLIPLVREHVAAIMQNHGVVTWGPDLETAYVLTETLEAVCRVVFQARQLGEVGRIPASERKLLAKLRADLKARGKSSNVERCG